MRRIAPLLFLLSLGTGCKEDGREPVRAQLGVFYGGQIQEREVWEVGVSSQNSLGFHLDLPASGAAPRRLEYQVTRPGPLGRRVTETREVSLGPEQRSFDQRLELLGAFGTWNVRVEVDGAVVLDRALVVKRPSSDATSG